MSWQFHQSFLSLFCFIVRFGRYICPFKKLLLRRVSRYIRVIWRGILSRYLKIIRRVLYYIRTFKFELSNRIWLTFLLERWDMIRWLDLRLYLVWLILRADYRRSYLGAFLGRTPRPSSGHPSLREDKYRTGAGFEAAFRVVWYWEPCVRARQGQV